MLKTHVEAYLSDGCGRCALYRTPQCKVHKWPRELAMLRMLVLDCGLTEELKWGVPCYIFNNNNIAVVAAFNEYCSISFFKGALLADQAGLLIKPGDNTQSARLIKFTDVAQIIELQDTIKAYIFDAIEIEKTNLKVAFKSIEELVFPAELLEKMDQDPIFKAAFEALTPGRQRGYNLHFSQPKNAATRASRIEKCVQKILAGKGFSEY
jgi:uncharacterized protein YdeI (YjbR/CyaY-like superfamily)